MRRFNQIMRHPLFSTAVAVWFFGFAWYQDDWLFGFMAGLIAAIAINDWSDLFFDRWKERYHRGHSREG